MKIIYILISLLISINSYSQIKEQLLIVDSIKLLCTYKQEVVVYNEETKIKNIEKYTTVLQIGESISKYYDYKGMIIDSIVWEESKKMRVILGPNADKEMKNITSLMVNKLKDIMYKNLPEKKITIKTYLAGSPYVYEELYKKPVWKLLKDTKTINGYWCKKATTYFKGRNYQAWYTTEIPVSDGPWKFCGLPGLILNIQDDKEEVSFVCQSITLPKTKIYIFKDVDTSHTIKLNKKEFNKIFEKYMENPAAFVMSLGMVSGLKPHPNSYKKRYYNPIELSE